MENKHYVIVDENGYITESWSDGPNPEKDTEKAICINEQGGYQFRLFPNWEENPALSLDIDVYRYKLVDGAPVECTAEEIAEQELLLIAQQ